MLPSSSVTKGQNLLFTSTGVLLSVIVDCVVQIFYGRLIIFLFKADVPVSEQIYIYYYLFICLRIFTPGIQY